MHSRFFELSHNMNLVGAADGTFRTVNAMWSSILGWSKEHIEARSVIELVHPDDRQLVEAALEPVMSGVERHVRVRARLQHENGSYRWIDWNVTRDEDAEHIYGTGQDVSQEIELREQLLEREARLELLAADLLRVRAEEHQRIANQLHDGALQQAIAAMLRFGVDGGDDPSIEGARTQVEGCVASIRAVIRGLDAPKSQEDLPDAARQIVEEVRSRFSFEVDLECSVAGAPSPIAAALACRILREALVNVGKHATGSPARARLIGDGHALLVRVEDDGTQTAAWVEPPRGPGAGLGMGSLGEAARVAGGELTIQFAPGGTTLTSRLPYEAPAPGAHRVPPGISAEIIGGAEHPDGAPPAPRREPTRHFAPSAAMPAPVRVRERRG